ncbi:hypothetical protein B7755_017755 [Streptomyces sp. NBS 14/10]|uniref:hypothetical protein n=1 Tax=Streptomyces sp. NBS 14/10 TaxID=1945643 RepID=UPI000B8008CF|nr:hypothetical protein [Streptomyces sp. NBS 14/10]KAK1179819.1 hypothetical protein B7755_017755 [Streptomyces sp. NBS 14/10]NUS86042.1 hypothetical protein [Streptomyces sp.]
MFSTRATRIRAVAVAAVAAGLLTGGITAGTSSASTTAEQTGTAVTDTAVNAAAAQPLSLSKFYGKFQKRDGCPYLVTSRGTHYYLPGYTVGGNGGLYKKGGGFIAYPGWRIQANGTKQYKPGGTTLCTTWGDDLRIKARSIYAR